MNRVQQVEQQDCQFCPEFLPGQPELWEKVAPEKQLEGIACCGGCAMFAGTTQDREYVGNAAARIKARAEQKEQSVSWHSETTGGCRCELCGYDRGKPEEYEVVATCEIAPVYQRQIYYRQEEPDEKTLLCRECLNWGRCLGERR